jgi:hypothetical protein
MRISEMTLQDRMVIFEYEDNFPLTVYIDGQVRQISQAEARELRVRGVDLEVDDKEVELILRRYGTC